MYGIDISALLLRCAVGEYRYTKYLRGWGVWKCVFNNGMKAAGNHVRDFSTKEEARAFVYERNGWNN